MFTAGFSSIPEIQNNASSGILSWLIAILSVMAGIWIYKSIKSPEKCGKDPTKTSKRV